MPEPEINIAVRLPQLHQGALRDVLSEEKTGCTVLKETCDALYINDDLQFDVATASEFLWTTLAFTGPFAASVAASLVAALIFALFQRKGKAKKRSEFIIRFPDATEVRCVFDGCDDTDFILHYPDGPCDKMSFDRPLDTERLQKAIEEHGTRS